MIFISMIMFTTLFGAIRLLSLVAIVMWVFSGIALIGVMEFDLEMIYFWFTLMLTFISLAIGSSVRVLYNERI